MKGAIADICGALQGASIDAERAGMPLSAMLFWALRKLYLWRFRRADERSV